MTIISFFQSFFEAINTIITRILIALFIIVFGFIIGRIIKKLLEKIFITINLDVNLRKITGSKYKISRILPYVLSIIIYAATIIFALFQLQIAFKYWFWAFIVVITIVLIIFLLEILDWIKNFFAGMSLTEEYNIKKGDTIEIENMVGKIISLEKDHLKMVIPSKDRIIVPYSFVLRNNVVLNRKP
jgi:small-conductance mechanosensitive channel